MRKLHIIPLLSAIALLGLAGCSDDPDCTSNTDCSGGDICVDEKCVAPQSACTPECGGETPICDEASKTCKTCTANDGCPANTVCDTSVAAGECVQCLDNDQCSGTTPVCDTLANTCVTCTATEGCASGETCDTTVTGGECKPAAAECTTSTECSGTTPICDTASGTCVTCTATEGCTDQVCDTSVTGGACVACLADTHCEAPTAICDTTAKSCVTCTATKGCVDPQVCDTSVSGGECKDPQTGCTDNASCTIPATPVCDTESGACVGCLSNTDCAEPTPVCNASKVCEAAATGDASAQITAVLAAGAAATSSTEVDVASLPVDGAIVTFVKPAIGSANNDPPGFVVQGAQTGPALFVAVVPDPVVAVGDKVSFKVTKMRVAGLLAATAITDLTRGTSGNDIAPLVQDLSNATDVVTGLDSYAGELITMTGKISGDFGGKGTDHVGAQFDTAGVQSNKMLLRLPIALRDALSLKKDCTLTLTNGVMWRFTTDAQPSAYEASQLTGVTCPAAPAPKVASASAASATEVVVTFDSPVAASSIVADGSQFTIAPALAVSAAVLTGNSVKLTTAAQTADTSYTVTVAATVTNADGLALDPTANTAIFTGFNPATCAKVVISQIFGGGSATAPVVFDFVELHNRGAAPVDVGTWSVQYAAAAGTAFSGKANLTGVIPSGGFLLVGLEGATDTTLPASDVTGAINLSGTNGIVALVASKDTLTGDCAAFKTGSVDLVGFGSNAKCFEGTGPALGASSTKGVVRADTCVDTNDNAADFSVADPPAPRNSATTAVPCTTCN